MKPIAVMVTVSALVAAPAAAETLKAVPARLDPAVAYILVEYRQGANPLGKMPMSAKYMPLVSGLALARYDALRRDIRGLGKAADNPVAGTAGPTEPFRKRPIAKGDGRQMMLLAVEPDVYVVQGFGATSFSLGSYSFRAEPGVITDLGVVEAFADYPPGEVPKPISVGGLFKMALVGPFAKGPAVAPLRATFRPRAAGDLAVPVGLERTAIHPVVFENGATFGNYLGGTVNRVEGVNAQP